ncbi:MAG TPA: hypothetical protein VLF40_05425 [Candidatus Saccharimonadales bacterium]|nr:hypothetical protein [Candidatus Saccharimonadales bacterium]
MNYAEAEPLVLPSTGFEPPLLVVSSDIALRHVIAARCLGLELSEADAAWHQAQHESLTSLMYEEYGSRVIVMDAAETAKGITEAVDAFRQRAILQGRTPFVVSVDPVFLDPKLADYTFQETRVVVIDPTKPAIDIEHTPRSHANRFTRLVAEPANGAGKPLVAQLAEVRARIAGIEGPVALALVEDFVNSGSSITERFGSFLDDPAIDTTIITGLANDQAYNVFRGRATITTLVRSAPGENVQHIDADDLVPTLGGRVIADNVASRVPALRTVTSGLLELPMAADAVYGRYPRQSDIRPELVSSGFMRRLGAFSVQTAVEFWSRLEQAAGHELPWSALDPLIGTLRIFYPARNHGPHIVPAAMVEDSPRKVVAAIAARYTEGRP